VNEQLTELDRKVVEWLAEVFMLCRVWGDSGDLIDVICVFLEGKMRLREIGEV
jgi:hypothetical protein